MINKILLFICLFTLSSCIQDPNGFLRKSANNKYFDTKGFHDSKRLPVYNGKYIERAKQNMLAGNYNRELELYEEAEERDEVESPSTYHREIYKQMLLEEQDPRSKQRKRSKKRTKSNKNFFSKITSADILNDESEINLSNIHSKKLAARSVKIQELDSTPVKASSHSDNVALDDFGDEIAFQDDMDIQEKVAKSDFLQENISNNFVENNVEQNLKLELEAQKKELHKELQDMRAMLELIRKEILLARNSKGYEEVSEKKQELSLNQLDDKFEIHRTFLLY